MVDMYLARKEPLLKDVIRGLARKDGFFRDIRFSKKLEYICQNANSVVVGSEEQAKLVQEGLSKTMNSKHLTGKAVDLAPFPIDWNNTKQFYYFAGMVLAVAKDMGIKIRWGLS